MPGPLTQKDRSFFEEHGYVVVPDVVSRALAAELGDAMRSYVEMTADERSGRGREGPAGAVHMFHHPLQWALRQSPRIYGAFAQLLDDPHLWVSIDRGKIVPPVGHGGVLQRGFIHWDINTLALPDPIPLQGLVALGDTVPGQGGFQCVPGFPARFARWAADQPAERHPYLPDLAGLNVVSVSMNAGDLVIWNALLPHGNSENRSTKPRVVQFVRMYPCRLYKGAVLERRLRMWQKKLPIDLARPTHLDWPEPVLTPLGERLLGLSHWL